MIERRVAKVPDWLDIVHESVFVRDFEGHILAWNSASESLYGWPRGDVLGLRADEILGSVYSEPLQVIQQKLADTGKWEGEITRRTAKDRELLVEARWSIHAGDDGTARHIVESARDVTERRIAEDALHYSEYRYRNLFHAMAASFWELDFSVVGAKVRELRKSGVTDFGRYLAAHHDLVRSMMRGTRVLDVNQRTVDLFGWNSKEERCGSVEPFWPEAGTQVFAASVVSAISGLPSFVTETRLQTLDGREFDVLFTACFPEESIKKGTLLIGVIDITERKQAQAALQRMQSELAHAARVATLGELTASIAHEVNQPLAAITTSGEASLRWLQRPKPDLDEVRQLTQRSISDARRAADIIERIRDMSKRRLPQPKSLCLNKVIEETAQFLRHELRAHEVTLDLQLGPALPVVKADRIQLQQVMVNLLMNAIQAVNHGHAEDRSLVVRTEIQETFVLVVVEDGGPGITPEHLPRLFDSFFTTKADGVGMGLPVCRSIVEAHGGQIAAANREGRAGACFSFTLPVASRSSTYT